VQLNLCDDAACVVARRDTLGIDGYVCRLDGVGVARRGDGYELGESADAGLKGDGEGIHWRRGRSERRVWVV
jgi:hypothetical protein